MRLNDLLKSRIRPDHSGKHGMLDGCFNDSKIVQLAPAIALGCSLAVCAGFVVHGLWNQNKALDGYEHLEIRTLEHHWEGWCEGVTLRLPKHTSAWPVRRMYLMQRCVFRPFHALFCAMPRA